MGIIEGGKLKRVLFVKRFDPPYANKSDPLNFLS
jgi:hypothetical protein